MNLVHRCRGLSRCFVWGGITTFLASRSWLLATAAATVLVEGTSKHFAVTKLLLPTPNPPTFSRMRVRVAKWSNKIRDILGSESGIALETTQRPTNYVLHHGAATHCRLRAQVYCHCIARTDGMCIYVREHVSNASRDGVSGSREPST